VDASGTMTLNGTVMADGVKPPASNCGGSSGGGIYLFCGRFRGAATGRLFAEGGDGFDGNEGPGGGGRIAVWDGFTEAERTAIVGGATLDRMAISNNVAFGFNGFAQVRIGSGYTDPVNYATPGTVRFLKKLPPAGSLIMVR